MHPYTIGLFGSIPDLKKDVARLQPIPGMIPDPSNLPPGCPFQTRCPRATERCRQENPPLHAVGGTHTVRCHLVEKGGLA